MTAHELKCIYCGRDSALIPLLPLRYQEREYWVCPEHLPILIHKPEQLVGKLPGFTPLAPYIDEHSE